MSVFADSSALVKLYVDEQGHEAVRAMGPVAVSHVARVEVPAAFWRKHRIGELGAVEANVLISEFEADFYGTAVEAPRFAVVAVTEEVCEQAARLCARFPLRAHDAIQLASALAAREADPSLATIAVFDKTLRHAASVEGLSVSP